MPSQVITTGITRGRPGHKTEDEQAEAIKKFIILDHDLTVDSGEVTPSLKVHRSAVEANYRETLDSLYAPDHWSLAE